MLASDAIALMTAFLLTPFLLSPLSDARSSAPVVWFAILLPLWLAIAAVLGLYRGDQRRANRRTVDEVGGLVIVAICASNAVAWVRADASSAGAVLAFLFLATLLLMAGRRFARSLGRRQPSIVQSAVILGAGEVGQLAARKLLRHPEYGIDLVGFIDTAPQRWRSDIGEASLLGPVEQLPEIVCARNIDRILIADSVRDDVDVLNTVRSLEGLDVHVDIVPRMYELIGPRAELHEIEGLPLLGLSLFRRSQAELLAKRALDLIGAVLGLVVAAPVFVYAAWRIRRDSPGPIFYRQTRLGANMREFTMLKFRTMAVDTDAAAHREFIERVMSGEEEVEVGQVYKLDRIDAVTEVGRWLRRTSLDELPQLINVLRGEMSLVGPRPCIPYETHHFEPHHFQRFQMPAGITGLWQVTARGHASFAEALDMDVAYIRNWTLGLDISLLLRTPMEVLRQRKATV